VATALIAHQPRRFGHMAEADEFDRSSITASLVWVRTGKALD
jgi:hypothetical protein